MIQNNAYHQAGNSQTNVISTFQHLQYGELHIKQDLKNNFFAIIAIHSTKRGPALGGCRFIPYTQPENAIIDALRLAQSMSYKAAISDLSLGGGKAVIIHSPQITNRERVFELFGEFVHSLNGRYITAEDSGTSVEDMDIVYKNTPHVTGHSQSKFLTDDPSPLTALGVVRGMEAAAYHHLNLHSLEGLKIVIQGVGNVGFNVAELCVERGAHVTIYDIDSTAVKQATDSLNVEVCYAEELYSMPCDIFSPCALGNAINLNTIHQLNTKIIAGAANNQLASIDLAQTLKEKGILYAPDYAINAGGLIHVAAQHYKESEQQAKEKVLRIYDTLLDIFETSDKTSQTTVDIANQMAEERLGNHQE